MAHAAARKRATEQSAGEVWRLMDDLAASGETGPKTFEEIQQKNQQRKRLLHMARKHSPLTSALKLRLLPRTVLPRLLRRSMTYMIFATFGGTAACAQFGVTEQDIDPSVFDGAGARPGPARHACISRDPR